MENCNAYSLSEVVELYCLHQFNDRKKNFLHYLPMGKLVWEDLLLRTLWNNHAKWMPVYNDADSPYPYIKVPEGMSAFLGLYDVDDCNQLVPLSQNNRYNVIERPKKTCGCSAACSCGDLCSGMSAMTWETRDVDINGTTYEEKTWIQVCGTGEVKRWRKTPVQTYTDANTYTVDYTETYESLCQLEVKPCGCIAETAENKVAIETHCGCSVGCTSKIYNRQDNHGLVEYKFSECGTKIYLIGANVKSQYLAHYQNKNAAASSPVPHYCLDAMFLGIINRSTQFNPTKRPVEKEYAKHQYKNAKLDVLKFLNPIRLEMLDRISGERKPW